MDVFNTWYIPKPEPKCRRGPVTHTDANEEWNLFRFLELWTLGQPGDRKRRIIPTLGLLDNVMFRISVEALRTMTFGAGHFRHERQSYFSNKHIMDRSVKFALVFLYS